jgi:hypothetical protein
MTRAPTRPLGRYRRVVAVEVGAGKTVLRLECGHELVAAAPKDTGATWRVCRECLIKTNGGKR